MPPLCSAFPFHSAQGLVVCVLSVRGETGLHTHSCVQASVRGCYFNLLVPEISVLQPEQLRHPGAIHFSIELHF